MGNIKPKKRKKRLQVRIHNFNSNRVIREMVIRHPGSYTEPGSLRKS